MNANKVDWTKEDIASIYRIDELFTNLFCPGYYQYEYTEKTKHCVLVPGQFPLIQYRHEEWEKTMFDAKQSSSPAAPPHEHNGSIAGGAPVTAETTAQQISHSRDITPPIPLLQQNSEVTEKKKPGTAATSQHFISISNAAMAGAPTLAQQLRSRPTTTAAAQQHSNNSCHSKMLRLENLNLISRGERAVLAVP